ncbi:MAG: hypothetical protein ACLFQA_09165 [Bacteroidales bacterium]
MKRIFLFTWLILSSANLIVAQSYDQRRIQPYSQNQYFWQYDGRPVLLIGGSSDDNLFQIENLENELDLIRLNGGNYIRNTMSCRDEGNEAPFIKSGDMYNPDSFNEEYWYRFERLLELSAERNIFVQIEIWAFHDFTGYWPDNPWNPSNNTLFTETNTKLKSEPYGHRPTYISHFFRSVPKLNNDKLLLSYQQKFVDKLMSISLKYDHVLYCITNEIFSQYSPEWGWYWSDYIKEKAKVAGIGIEVTEMFQTVDIKHDQHKASLDFPDKFSYIELSQNSFNSNQEHWDFLQWARNYVAQNPRPINHVKLYGGLLGSWTSGPTHGIERFWRSIIGGAASARFHRPPYGIGISERAQKHMLSASMLANEYNFFSSLPDVNSTLLLDRDADEAYLAKNSFKDIVVYFPDGGNVILNLIDFPGTYNLKWLNIEAAVWEGSRTINGGVEIELKPPFFGNWVALLSFEK